MSKLVGERRTTKQKDRQNAKKKNYVSPKLVEYGSLTELTKGGGSLLNPDGGSSKSMI